jgi:hypothetical protein
MNGSTEIVKLEGIAVDLTQEDIADEIKREDIIGRKIWELTTKSINALYIEILKEPKKNGNFCLKGKDKIYHIDINTKWEELNPSESSLSYRRKLAMALNNVKWGINKTKDTELDDKKDILIERLNILIKYIDDRSFYDNIKKHVVKPMKWLKKFWEYRDNIFSDKGNRFNYIKNLSVGPTRSALSIGLLLEDIITRVGSVALTPIGQVVALCYSLGKEFIALLHITLNAMKLRNKENYEKLTELAELVNEGITSNCFENLKIAECNIDVNVDEDIKIKCIEYKSGSDPNNSDNILNQLDEKYLLPQSRWFNLKGGKVHHKTRKYKTTHKKIRHIKIRHNKYSRKTRK